MNDATTKGVFIFTTSYTTVNKPQIKKSSKRNTEYVGQPSRKYSWKHFEYKPSELIYKHAIKTMKKCIKGNICENFTDYFEIHIYYKSTRNRNLLLIVPKVRLEFEKVRRLEQIFCFEGVKLSNFLHIKIWRIKAYKEKTKLLFFLDLCKSFLFIFTFWTKLLFLLH